MPNPTNAVIIFASGQLSADVVLTGNVKDGELVNADFSASAALAWSKISKTSSRISDLASHDINDTDTTLTVAKGGTGQVSLAAHAVVLGNATTGVATAAPSTSGYVLTDNGASTDPSFQPAPSEWTYVSKLTWAAATGSQTFSSLAAHDYYKLIFHIKNGGTAAGDKITIKFTLNANAGNAYAADIADSAGALGSALATAWNVSTNGGNTGFADLMAEVVISGKHFNGIKNIHTERYSKATSSDVCYLTGRLTGNSADVSSIEILNTTTNAITGTVELWFRDEK